MAYVSSTSSSAWKRRVARRLFNDGATSQWSARAFEPMHDRERHGLEEGLTSGLIVRTEAGTYYVPAERYEAMRVQERWALIVIVAVLLIGLAVLYLTGEFTS
jgi:hypothetical protein